ncbi:MAG: N-acetylglutamate synthase-like GNAT family acetyltransferase [Saprospiraceae bacterium]|jgi:N-acetylglutamate synthase-like GNAT family acetyltransferase
MTFNDIHIRTHFEPGDIGYIIFLHGDYYDFGLMFEVYVAQTLADFYKNMNPEKERIWIAEHQGKIIGSIALKNTNDEAQLRYFFIKEEYRGIGLGKKMLDLFMAFMQECGYQSSFLLTEEKLKTALHLYTKYGYKFVSSKDNGMGLIEQRFEKSLKHLDLEN